MFSFLIDFTVLKTTQINKGKKMYFFRFPFKFQTRIIKHCINYCKILQIFAELYKPAFS